MCRPNHTEILVIDTVKPNDNPDYTSTTLTFDLSKPREWCANSIAVLGVLPLNGTRRPLFQPTPNP